MIQPRQLVIGVGGFLDGRVTRQPVTAQEGVRIMVRPNGSKR